MFALSKKVLYSEGGYWRILFNDTRIL